MSAYRQNDDDDDGARFLVKKRERREETHKIDVVSGRHKRNVFAKIGCVEIVSLSLMFNKVLICTIFEKKDLDQYIVGLAANVC